MNKNILLRVISGQASEIEKESVHEWLSKDPKREEYYIVLKNIWTSQHLSNEKASQEDIDEMQALIQSRNNKRIPAKVYKYVSIAACLLLGISLFFNFIGFKHKGILGSEISVLTTPAESNGLQESLQGDEMQNYIYTVKGTKAKVVLPDSSIVWLNSDSKISYPTQFSGNTREVAISGEALFEVRKNPNMPMVVTTQKGFKVKVYGTIFNIRSYSNDSIAMTALYRGNIELITKNKDKGDEIVTKVKPNQIFKISDNEPDVAIEAKNIDISTISAWKDGKLIFESEPLGNVIKILERWYGVTFIVPDNSMLNYNITATFNNESIIQIVDMIKYCVPIDYKMEGNSIKLRKR